MSLLARISTARAAMKELAEDPEKTEKVFVIVEALSGKNSQRLLRSIRQDPAGIRLLRERPVFDTSTCDLDDLLALPAGSFGRTFAEWMTLNGFEPGLMERKSSAPDPEVAYLSQRLTQVHDFWHVLTGYNRDPVGELGVLAFGWAQMHSLGIGYLLGTILMRSTRSTWSEGKLVSPLLPFMWRAYRAGRRARFLAPLVLEDLFEMPLDEARGLLGVEPLRESISAEALPPIAAPLAAGA